MPFTVITLKKVPPSLRGDLTKWMQEIATGVYVGNFNSKVREEIWERVKENVAAGEATLSYSTQNEIGYSFETRNTRQTNIDFDGIPLVQWANKECTGQTEETKRGISNAAKFRQARKYSVTTPLEASEKESYVILDIETDGLNERQNKILEIGAIRIEGNSIKEFQTLVTYEKNVPKKILELTGITTEMLKEKGICLNKALDKLLRFLGTATIVGYGVEFDCRFINYALRNEGKPPLSNKVYDIMKFVKKEKMFLGNYKLYTVLKAYGIQEEVPHRALADAKLIHALALKVNGFDKVIR